MVCNAEHTSSYTTPVYCDRLRCLKLCLKTIFNFFAFYFSLGEDGYAGEFIGH